MDYKILFIFFTFCGSIIHYAVSNYASSLFFEVDSFYIKYHTKSHFDQDKYHQWVKGVNLGLGSVRAGWRRGVGQGWKESGENLKLQKRSRAPSDGERSH